MGHCTLVFEPSARALLWGVTSVLVSHSSFSQRNTGKGFVGVFISPKELNRSRDPFAVLHAVPSGCSKAATCRNSHSPRSVHVK